mmetsp:Transcript_19/g.60  ORF Transcript_19/g.60 Transcript_19/m.60 type:complete len:570 (-) Transcript_19:1377-3086(-)
MCSAGGRPLCTGVRGAGAGTHSSAGRPESDVQCRPGQVGWGMGGGDWECSPSVLSAARTRLVRVASLALGARPIGGAAQLGHSDRLVAGRLMRCLGRGVERSGARVSVVEAALVRRVGLVVRAGALLATALVARVGRAVCPPPARVVVGVLRDRLRSPVRPALLVRRLVAARLRLALRQEVRRPADLRNEVLRILRRLVLLRQRVQLLVILEGNGRGRACLDAVLLEFLLLLVPLAVEVGQLVDLLHGAGDDVDVHGVVHRLCLLFDGLGVELVGLHLEGEERLYRERVHDPGCLLLTGAGLLLASAEDVRLDHAGVEADVARVALSRAARAPRVRGEVGWRRLEPIGLLEELVLVHLRQGPPAALALLQLLEISRLEDRHRLRLDRYGAGHLGRRARLRVLDELGHRRRMCLKQRRGSGAAAGEEVQGRLGHELGDVQQQLVGQHVGGALVLLARQLVAPVEERLEDAELLHREGAGRPVVDRLLGRVEHRLVVGLLAELAAARQHREEEVLGSVARLEELLAEAVVNVQEVVRVGAGVLHQLARKLSDAPVGQLVLLLSLDVAKVHQ